MPAVREDDEQSRLALCLAFDPVDNLVPLLAVDRSLVADLDDAGREVLIRLDRLVLHGDLNRPFPGRGTFQFLQIDWRQDALRSPDLIASRAAGEQKAEEKEQPSFHRSPPRVCI